MANSARYAGLWVANGTFLIPDPDALCGLAAAAASLHGRATHRTVRAKYAAITFQRLQPLTATFAVVEELAGISWHRLD